MADNIKTTFEAMGDEGIPSSVINLSGQRSPYTRVRPRGGAVAGDDLPSSTGNRSQSLTNAEVLGPQCAPQTTLYYPNAADHEATGRNTRIVPSRTGVADNFWGSR